MNRREGLGWGLVGGLSFLVLVQGSELLSDERLDLVAEGVVATAVLARAGLLAAAMDRRLGNGSA